MNEERMQILNMLAEGKINPQEAEQLLAALEPVSPADPQAPPTPPAPPAFPMEKGEGEVKFLFVKVTPKAGADDADMVNIRVPLALIKAGLDFAKFIPDDAQIDVNEAMEKNGINLNGNMLKDMDYDSLVAILSELDIDIETKDQTVKVYTG